MMTISKMQHVEPTSQVGIVNYSEFSSEFSEATDKVVELAGTLEAKRKEEES
jgi:phosphotransacetylase